MARSRLFRFSDRHSYKPSEVVGLFLVSLFLGMFVYAICVAANFLVDSIFG